MLQLNFQSFPTLQTERLLLRAHLTTDAKFLFALRSNEEVMRYIDRENPKNLEETEAKIKLMQNEFDNKTSIAWVIAFKEDPDEMIGEIGYYRTDLANYRAEVGYMLYPDFWRRGLISEALSKVIDFGFREMKLHSISGNINPGNDACRQILLKHGFQKEVYFKGKFLDSEIYSLVNLS